MKICTVIGFPNGNTTTTVKVFETRDAVENGADEIDMVVNLGMVKAGEYEQILGEIRAVKAVSYTHLDVYKRQVKPCLCYQDSISLKEAVREENREEIGKLLSLIHI